jgi:hypothetical protein
MQRKTPHKTRHNLPALFIGNNENVLYANLIASFKHAKNE